jgi:hypothetical protein
MDFLSLTKGEPSIEDLDIQFNPDGWGPMACERLDVFGDVPYTHFDKKDKLGRHADFVMAAMPSYQQKSSHYQKRRDDFYQNNDFSFKHDTVEDSTFQLVDTAKTQSKSKFGKSKCPVSCISSRSDRLPFVLYRPQSSTQYEPTAEQPVWRSAGRQWTDGSRH